MPLATGQILNNRYRIAKLLGQGGFGAVYRAWDTNLERPCALKENLDASVEAARQFKREAQILVELAHPNLPRVFDYFSIPAQGQYVVMDFIEGQDLQELLVQNNKPLPEPTLLPWTIQVCDALEYLHSRSPSIIHRDIKPANIRITPEGRAMLVDFGLAKIYDPNRRTTMGARAVTPGYAPFEQYGQRPTDARSDIYALGATLYHLLTGQAPPESIDRVAGTKLIQPHQLNPSVSLKLEAVLTKSLELFPEERFQEISEFKNALLDLSIQPVAPRLAPVRTGTTISPTLLISSMKSINYSLQHKGGQSDKLVVKLAQGVDLVLICIPGGEFWMGSDPKGDNHADNNEFPQHEVYLEEYWIGIYPITNIQYKVFVDTHRYLSTLSGNSIPKDKENNPVIKIKWADAVAFCKWASQINDLQITLPTEAQWEKAARGIDRRIFPWGNISPNKSLANYGGNPFLDQSTPVGKYSPDGDSPYGCADMAGNVWEWVADFYQNNYYKNSPPKNPLGPNTGERHVLRGGAWSSYEKYLRVTARGGYDPNYSGNYGFRCVCSF